MKKAQLVKLIRAHEGPIKVRIQAALDDQSIFIPVSKASVIKQFAHLGDNDYTGISFSMGRLSSDDNEFGGY